MWVHNQRVANQFHLRFCIVDAGVIWQHMMLATWLPPHEAADDYCRPLFLARIAEFYSYRATYNRICCSLLQRSKSPAICHNSTLLLFTLPRNELLCQRFGGHIDYCTKKETTLRVGHFTTTSGHFSANCINIFHKTGDQRNVLRCLTCLNLNWINSYDIKHNLIHFLGFSILKEKKLKSYPA